MNSPDLFPAGTYKDIRPKDKLDELVRELTVRRRVYPRWIEMKKLNVVTADRRILVMQAILEDYRDPRMKKLEALLEEWSELRDWSWIAGDYPELDERTRKELGLPERGRDRYRDEDRRDG